MKHSVAFGSGFNSMGLLWGLLISAGLPLSAWAGSDRPILTLVQGEVMILSSPRDRSHGDSEVPKGQVRSKFDGKHYLSRKPAVGDEVELDAWIRTFPGARARLVYPNGDQLNVGPGSFLKIESRKPDDESASREGMTFEYGSVRAIISKTGPRSGIRIRSRSATMGVRGTDLVIEELGSRRGDSTTAVTLIRGSLSVQPKGARAAQEVRSGETAMTGSKSGARKYATSQTELKRSLVLTEQSPAVQVRPESVRPEVAEKLKALEKQAREATVEDMVRYAATPEEKARIEALARDGASAQKLNAAAVAVLVVKAPADSPGLKLVREEDRKNRKLTDSELKELEGDAYQKYYDSTQGSGQE
jgi:hypothetical protein